MKHGDRLLAEHGLVLDDQCIRLFDSITNKLADKSRVKAYIEAWQTDPGFPGLEVIKMLQEDING